MRGGIGDQRRRWALWLGLLALCANLLLALAPPQANAASNGRQGSLLNDLYTICTPLGIITLGEEGEVPPPDPAGHQPDCVFCLPLSNPMAGLLAPAVPALVPCLAETTIRFSAPLLASAHDGRAVSPYLSRAPPLSLATG